MSTINVVRIVHYRTKPLVLSGNNEDWSGKNERQQDQAAEKKEGN
jgi:hypothetical protein